MVIELYSDDRRTPDVAVTADVLTVRGVRGNGPRTATRYRMPAATRRGLEPQRDAALEVLRSVADTATLVEHVDDGGWRAPLRRLVIGAGADAIEIEWAYPDRVPDAVKALADAVDALSWTVPRQYFERTVVRRCREAAAQQTATPANEWTVVSKSRESFDHFRSLPDMKLQPGMVMTAEAYDGYRVTLQRGDVLRAYHTVAPDEILFAETWNAADLPRYAPALLDIAHARRASGDLDGAVDALDAVISHAQWSEADQAHLELAEIYAQQGKYSRAESVYTSYIGAGSQDQHVIAVAGLAWVAALRKAGPDSPLAATPPTRWAELELYPWWRGDGKLVKGVPATDPALKAAVDGARGSHHQAWNERHGFGRGVA